MRLFAAVLILTSIGCDQATKVIATRTLRGEPVRSYLGDTFRLVYAENAGAFLGLGGTLGEGVRFGLLTVLVGAFLIGGLVYLFVKTEQLTRQMVLAGALVLSGGLSNWFDRLMNEGRVVDFMNLGVGSLRTGIFNVADLAIMAALPLVLFSPKPKAGPPGPA